jgi:hypothetical protein
MAKKNQAAIVPLRIWVHAKRSKGTAFESEGLRPFARVPALGEHFVLGHDSPWFKVVVVFHCLPGSDSDVEIYGLEVDGRQTLTAAGKTGR